MLVSYNYFAKVDKGHYSFELIDDDFSELVDVFVIVPETNLDSNTIGRIRGAILDSVIDLYERRNLPVALNILKLIQYQSKFVNSDISRVLEWTRKYSSKFSKYEEQINKYLLLM